MKDHVTFQYRTGAKHAVYAGGGPRDGFPYGFRTICNRPIWRDDLWKELPNEEPDCGTCLRIARSKGFEE